MEKIHCWTEHRLKITFLLYFKASLKLQLWLSPFVLHDCTLLRISQQEIWLDLQWALWCMHILTDTKLTSSLLTTHFKQRTSRIKANWEPIFWHIWETPALHAPAGCQSTHYDHLACMNLWVKSNTHTHTFVLLSEEPKWSEEPPYKQEVKPHRVEMTDCIHKIHVVLHEQAMIICTYIVR